MWDEDDDCIECGEYRWNAGVETPVQELSPDQAHALQQIMTALAAPSGNKRKVLVLAGPAGTGKTTLMRRAIADLRAQGWEVILMAPTGKAAARLHQTTGEPTGTIHSRAFVSPQSMGVCAQCDKPSEALAMSEVEARREGLSVMFCPECGARYTLAEQKKLPRVLGFTRREDWQLKSQRHIAIVDEASMVSLKLHEDLDKSLPKGVPILYVGDREQLPPVGDTWGPDFARPTAVLTQIHRQAAGNPIIVLATRLRNDQNRTNPFEFEDLDAALRVEDRRLRVYPKMSRAQVALWAVQGRRQSADMTVITHSNRDRVDLNNMIRTQLGHAQQSYTSGLPVVPGDKLMVLANNTAQGIYNGEVYTVTHGEWPASAELARAGFFAVTFAEKPSRVYLIAPSLLGKGASSQEVAMVANEFRGGTKPFVAKAKQMMALDADGQAEDPEDFEAVVSLDYNELFDQFGAIRPDDLLHVDFGEAITAHKAQGSQWDTVGIVWRQYQTKWWKDKDQAVYEDQRRWLYTALTRAQRRVVIFLLTD